MRGGVDRLARDCGPDGENGQVRDGRCGPHDIRFGNHVLSASATGPPTPSWSSPSSGRSRTEAGSGSKSLSSADGLQVPALTVPGLRPVSIKGIQAALRALGPSFDRVRPTLAEARGAGLPAPEQERQSNLCLACAAETSTATTPVRRIRTFAQVGCRRGANSIADLQGGEHIGGDVPIADIWRTSPNHRSRALAIIKSE